MSAQRDAIVLAKRLLQDFKAVADLMGADTAFGLFASQISCPGYSRSRRRLLGRLVQAKYSDDTERRFIETSAGGIPGLPPGGGRSGPGPLPHLGLALLAEFGRRGSVVSARRSYRPPSCRAPETCTCEEASAVAPAVSIGVGSAAGTIETAGGAAVATGAPPPRVSRPAGTRSPAAPTFPADPSVPPGVSISGPASGSGTDGPAGDRRVRAGGEDPTDPAASQDWLGWLG